MKNLAYSTIKTLVKFGLFLIHEKIEVFGLENVPRNKPVLFLPNHQSALIDVLLIAVDCNRKPYFLTRSDVFGKPLLNAIFKYFRMIPIYRIRDGRGSLVKNDEVFDSCAEVLGREEAIVMFPEANHNLKRRVRPLSKGFTRVLFRAMEKYPDLDIQLVPVGLNYREATHFPDAVSVHFGKPIATQSVYSESDLLNTTNALKEKVSESLKQLTTHIAPEEKYDAIINELKTQNVNFLRPNKANILVRECAKKPLSANKSKIPQRQSYLFYPFVLLNLPIVFMWWFVIKPKVWEPEFMGTIRFATACIGFVIYYPILFVILLFLMNLKVAVTGVLLLFAFNFFFVKWGQSR